MSRLTRKTSLHRPPHSLLLFALALVLEGRPDAQTKVICRQGVTGTVECGSPLALSYIPQLPALKIEGATVGRLLYDDGTAGAWLNPGTAGRILTSNGAGLVPSYQPFPSFPASQITGGTIGRIFYDDGTAGAWLSPGTTGRVLTSNGAGLVPSYQPFPSFPASQITGGTIGRIFYDDGTAGAWLSPGTTGRVLTSNGAGLVPSYQPFPSFPASQITGGTIGRIFYDDGTSGAWLGAGAAGYVMTANGAGLAPSWQAVPTVTTVSAILATSTFNLTGTFANIGLTLVLPNSGRWAIHCNVRLQLQVTVGTGSLTIRLHNGAAAITNSERISPYSPVGAFTGATVPLDMVVVQAGPSTYDVQGNTTAGATYSTAQALRDGSGSSYCAAVYLGP